jgi:hypothetical protein
MFCGFHNEGEDITLTFPLTDQNRAPVDPDANPTFRVFGQDGPVASGTGSASPAETGTITGATNASPIVVTSAAHGLPTGAYVKVASVVGNTAANGNFFVTALSGSTFSLDGSTGNGAYTSGGTWRTLGLYKLTLTGAVLAGLEAGKTYTVQINYAVGAAARISP